MLKIVAVGGGSIGRGGTPSEVTPLSREMIRLAARKNPRLLFLPTATRDDPGYVEAVQNHFGRELKCRVETLLLVRKPPSLSEIRRKISGTDIIYVGGGNTLLMMNLWKRLGVDRLLRAAAAKGKVLCGPSAGAICWFRQGNSDSRKFRNPNAKLIKVTGLGLIDALACPHYDVEKDRKPELREMMKKTKGVAVAMDNGAALEVAGRRYRALASKSGAGVYRVFWLSGKFHQEKMPVGKWKPLDGLRVK